MAIDVFFKEAIEKSAPKSDSQELIIDSGQRVIESHGSLLLKREIGEKVQVGASLSKILIKFWNNDLDVMCREATQKGKTSTRMINTSWKGTPLVLFFESAPYVERGIILGAKINIKDISVEKRLEQRNFLREKMAIIAVMASQIVHKMNNPIAAILNRLGGLLIRNLDELEPDELAAELEKIQNQVYSLSLITNALTAFGRDQREDYRLRNINSILEKAVALIKLIRLEKDIRYHIDFDPKLPDVFGCEMTLEQCFVNILRNSMEAMPKGGTITISTRIDQNFKDSVNISISDNGLGIVQDQLDYVFDPFYTTKSNVHSGLGLTVCYGIVSNHKGNIEIVSEENVGTTVSITLPIENID